MGSIKFVLALLVFASLFESAFSDHDPNHVSVEGKGNKQDGSEENTKKLKDVLKQLANPGQSSSSPPSETSESSTSTTKTETSTTSSFSSSSLSSSSTSSPSSSTSSKSSSSSNASTAFAAANSTSSYWSLSTVTFTPPNEEYCYTDAVLQVPNRPLMSRSWILPNIS